MRRSCRVFSLTLLSVVIPGCEKITAPTAYVRPGHVERNLASGCYAVAFTWTASPSSDVRFTGPLAGDLQGTMASDFDPNSLKFAGTTLAVSFTDYWTITGGVLPAPVSFVTVSRGLNHLVDRPQSPAEVVEHTARFRAASGVQLANLTASIRVDFTVPPGGLVANFHGVICP